MRGREAVILPRIRPALKVPAFAIETHAQEVRNKLRQTGRIIDVPPDHIILFREDSGLHVFHQEQDGPRSDRPGSVARQRATIDNEAVTWREAFDSAIEHHLQLPFEHVPSVRPLAPGELDEGGSQFEQANALANSLD